MKKHMRQWILFCIIVTLFVPFSAQAGARFVRVHNVKMNAMAIRMTEGIMYGTGDK